jgi:hypothetical protein
MAVVKSLVGAAEPIQFVPVAHAVVPAAELQSIVVLQALGEEIVKTRTASANLTQN